MNIQAFVLALKLMAINIYAQILATATKFQFSTLYTTVYLTSARTMPSPRIQLFRRLNSRHTNNSAFSSSTPGPADKDPAHELMGLQVFMVVLTIFAIITIIVGEVMQWRRRRELLGVGEPTENLVDSGGVRNLQAEDAHE